MSKSDHLDWNPAGANTPSGFATENCCRLAGSATMGFSVAAGIAVATAALCTGIAIGGPV